LFFNENAVVTIGPLNSSLIVTTLLSPHRTPVVNKTLLHLLTALFVTVTALPGMSRAAVGGDDYVAVQVPDVTQAVTFFRDVMNCGTIQGDSSAVATAQVALMSCGRGTTVEISRIMPASLKTLKVASLPSPMLTLDTDDAAGVAAWLHTHRIHLIGSPTQLRSGPDSGKVAVTFLTPWGQPLRLVSRNRADDLFSGTMSSSRIAAQ
jgi:hypothetical protein